VAICLYRTVAEKGSGSDLQQVMAFDDQVTYGQPKPGQLSDTGPITTASSVVVQRFAITMDVITFEAVPGQSTFHPTKVGSKPPIASPPQVASPPPVHATMSRPAAPIDPRIVGSYGSTLTFPLPVIPNFCKITLLCGSHPSRAWSRSNDSATD
jgi:hypothetical protein